jgi:hypothetical protein
MLANITLVSTLLWHTSNALWMLAAALLISASLIQLRMQRMVKARDQGQVYNVRWWQKRRHMEERYRQLYGRDSLPRLANGCFLVSLVFMAAGALLDLLSG